MTTRSGSTLTAQEAIQKGRLKPADLAAWLRLSAVPLLGQLARMSPGGAPCWMQPQRPYQ